MNNLSLEVGLPVFVDMSIQNNAWNAKAAENFNEKVRNRNFSSGDSEEW